VKQGRLGRLLDYGTLKLMIGGIDVPVYLKNVPNPVYYANRILDLIDPQDLAMDDKKKNLSELIAAGESQYVEYKSSFIWDYHRQSPNKELNVPTLKNVTAFMNTTGGMLLIGVGDDGEVLGIENDIMTLRTKDMDGFENTFNNAFNRMIGAEYRRYLDVWFEEMNDNTVCLLSVTPSPHPVYFKHRDKEYFYSKQGIQASRFRSARRRSTYNHILLRSKYRTS